MSQALVVNHNVEIDLTDQIPCIHTFKEVFQGFLTPAMQHIASKCNMEKIDFAECIAVCMYSFPILQFYGPIW